MRQKIIPGSCFANNYNPFLLKAWEANLDIQLVHNCYKVLTYMTGYFAKSENEVSKALKLAARETKIQNLNVPETIKKLHICL